ncbi:hypothetical protein Tco_1332753 [Tanacetum coccineum]
MEKSEQAKVVIVEHEEPDSSKKLKNLHGISFLSDSQEEKSMINYLQRNLIQDILRFPAPSVKDSVWSERYSECCKENSYDKKPRPRE